MCDQIYLCQSTKDLQRPTKWPYSVGMFVQYPFKVLQLKFLFARLEIQADASRTQTMKLPQFTIGHILWVDTDYGATFALQSCEGVDDGGIVRMIYGEGDEAHIRDTQFCFESLEIVQVRFLGSIWVCWVQRKSLL